VKYTCQKLAIGDERTPEDNLAGLQKELAKHNMKKFTATNTRVAVEFVVKLVQIADGRQQMISTLRLIIKECIT
jgi:hypothetical protein